MTTPRLTAFIITALVLSGGCSQQDATASQPGEQPANVAMKTPPIYLRQTAVTMKYGPPYVETQYKQQLSRCQKLQGRISVSPIPSELADKLGRTYYQIWLKGERAAVQSKSWGFTEGDGLKMCHFHAVSHTRKSIDNVHDTYRINLDKGTATRQSSSPVVRHAIKPQTPAQKAADARQRSEVVAELKKKGYAGALDTAPSKPPPAKVAGQPCAQTSSPADGESCVWTGGGQWGFTPIGRTLTSYISGYDALLTHVNIVLLPGDSILLSNTPPDDGIGDRLTTQTMTVGKPFDAHVFEVAPNISVQPTGQ